MAKELKAISVRKLNAEVDIDFRALILRRLRVKIYEIIFIAVAI